MKILTEKFNDLKLPNFLEYEIELSYDDLDLYVEDEWYEDYWDYSTESPEQHGGVRSGTINYWNYVASDDEVYEALEKYFNKDLDKITQQELNNIDKNKYMDILYDLCRKSAEEDARENHEWYDVIEDEPDWDSMPSGHNDYIENFDESKKKKKSITNTTGDIQKNIDHFNKLLVGKAKNTHLDGLSSVEVQKAAEEYAKSVGTFASQSPDGASSISTDAGSSSEGMSENLHLNEDKRYVRRYFIRPQHIWCSNKNDILKALIEIDKKGQNCSVYTLNNLTDNDDITKLTTSDIIYYYDDGILYDKNHVKVMDYNLLIKHEENRDDINPDKVSDATFKDVYNDRVTDLTMEESLDEAFYLSFTDINAYGEKLIEGKEKDGICCICGEEIDGYGNNPEPYMSAENGRCCDACNLHFVIPARLSNAKSKEKDQE